MIPLDDIRAAAERLRGRLHRTPLVRQRSLGEMAGVELHVKCECFQKTGSFKPRGALNKVLSLSADERGRGLVTVSAGNNAQAVAWAAREVGAPAVVVMPTDAPRSKLDAVRGYGAEVVLHGDRATLFDKLREVERERGLTFVHPFDDPVVLAGAGTVGLELAEDLADIDAVIVGVGGGGLFGGITSALHALAPRARVIAAELASCPGLAPALAADAPVTVARDRGTIADGLTPPFVGALPLAIAKAAGVEVVGVTEQAIVDGMRALMTRAKLYVEGSGAAATAALLSGAVRLPAGSRVVAIVSGCNVDPERAFAVLGGGA